MPYSKISDAPENVRKLDGVKLTLSQINWIARVADGIPEDSVDSPWAVAIAQFKKAHKKKDDKWVKKSKDEEKEFINDGSFIHLKQREDGKYEITAVSTAALKDRERETFTTRAMDYDIQLAQKTGLYPEFRVFHKKALGIGEVKSMSRVGIFAIDRGVSYDDPFSLAVCEKMLSNNEDGRWRVSRGFNALEVAGGCPECGEMLVIQKEHMIAGYRCPSCGTVNLGYKGILKDVQFRKARTFDVTVTDVPAVPWTGVSASLIDSNMEEYKMDREQLKEKLLEAGIEKSLIDGRLKQLSDEDIAAYADIPDAKILKDFEEDNEEDEEKEAEVLVLDPEVLEDFGKVAKEMVEEAIGEGIAEQVSAEVIKALEGIEVDLQDVDIELKELGDLVELKEILQEIKEGIDLLLVDEEERLKEMLEGSPRAGRLRIKRFKGGKNKDDDEEEEEDEEDEESFMDKLNKKKEDDNAVIKGADGREAKSMTEFVTAGGG